MAGFGEGAGRCGRMRHDGLLALLARLREAVYSVSEPLLLQELTAIRHPVEGLPYGGQSLALVKEAKEVYTEAIEAYSAMPVPAAEHADVRAEARSVAALAAALAAAEELQCDPSALTGARALLGRVQTRQRLLAELQKFDNVSLGSLHGTVNRRRHANSTYTQK